MCPARARATAPRHLLACLPAPPLLLSMPRTTPRPPLLSLTLPRFFLSSPSLSLSQPNTTIAAVRHSSRHRPPLAPPTSSGAPPRPPLPPHRSTGLRKPCIAAYVAVPLLGHRRSSPSIRCTPAAPEPTKPPYSSAVSLRAEPLSLPSRLRALGHSSAAAELRPPLTSSPPSLQPLELVSERVTALRKPPGA